MAETTHFEAGDENHARVSKVYLDGVDVTCLCRECDTAAGWADLYKTDAAGKIAVPPVVARHRGIVKVKLHG